MRSNSIAAHERQSGQVTSILLVDDDTLSNQVVARRLAREGYNLTTASGGREALEILERQRFDLILLDYEMPLMDGVDTLRRLRAHPHSATTPIVMLSGDNDPVRVQACLAEGANGYLVKPLVVPLMRDQIERLVHPTSAAQARNGQQAPTATTRVLVVDDDDLSCRLLEQLLPTPMYRVTSVTQPETVPEMLERETFDVVLLDIEMPGTSGTELLKQIRNKPAARNVPVVMVTGTNEVTIMLDCIDFGADGYITKPVDVSQLRHAIQSAIETRRQGVLTQIQPA